MIVAQVFGATAMLWDGESRVEATLAKRLKMGADRRTTILAVGDEVDVERDARGALSIVAISPRRTYLSRAAGHQGEVQIIAANAEQAVIVSSVAEPPFRPGLVDRWALLAVRGGITPYLCVNKVDLLSPEEVEREIAAAAAPLPHVLVSAKTGAGVKELHDLLRGSITVLVGHSGVGKSSLLHEIIPEEEIATGEVSAKNLKGRHTTTSSRLYHLPGGGIVIDTPGVRSVSLGPTTAQEVAAIFPEIHGAPPCRFRECTHRMEPGCSVLAGVETGDVPRQVYGRYRKLLLEAEVM